VDFLGRPSRFLQPIAPGLPPRSLVIAWLWAFLLIGASSVGAQGLAPDAPPATSQAVKSDRAALADPLTPWAERLSAAEALVAAAQGQTPGALEAIKRGLDDDLPTDASRAVLQALSACEGGPPNDGLVDAVLTMRSGLPSELEAAWARALGRYELERIADALAELAGDAQAPLEERRLAIRALGEHRALFAATLLIDLTSVNRLEQVQGWAFDALAELTHQPALGRDRAAWARWFNRASTLSASQWRRMLHENLLRQTRQREDVDKQMRDRLIQTQRALYRATEAERRPALLIQFLTDPLDQVRLLGLDLARQLAEDGGEFNEALREQLRSRLDDPLARIREESATLLGQLLDEKGADAMAARLSQGRELESSVRRAYLLALTQMPRAVALRTANDLLEDPALGALSAGALAAAHRAELGDDAFWAVVRDRVRKTLDGVDSPKSQAVTLLGLVIAPDDTDDWSRIGGWLNAEDERVREAAARAWAGSSRSLAVLAERSDDAVIRPIALKAVAERGTRKETLRAVAARRPTEPEDIRLWERAMVALAGKVDPGALLTTIDNLEDHNGETRLVREQMLTAAIDREDKPDPPTRDHLRLLVARAQVRVLDDAPALVVLDYEAALQHADQLTAPQRDDARRGLARAYLADRRVDDALATASAVLKPGDELTEDAGQDPLVDVLIDAAMQAAQQGRKDDAAKAVAGVRKLLGTAMSEPRETQLDEVQAEIDKEPPAEPAS
jgi:hypothetical protein